MNLVRNIKSGLIVGVMLLLVSCNSWLEVDPDDRIMDNSLFKDREGFLAALNGVYSEMNDPKLYGANLTMGMLDVMAQYYNCNFTDHDYSVYANYSYTEKGFKSTLDNIWSGLYSMIANCNAILAHCGDGNPVLSDTYYRLVKGEALGLRAMMHLDLVRMFGPVYSEENKEIKCIPYMTKADRGVQPLLSADSVIYYVIKDLEIASSLLSTVDPVITEGARNHDSEKGTNDLYYRQYRMNYFAVNALMARAYLWIGNTQKAGECARTVIAKVSNEDKPLFPLVNVDYMTKNSPDGVFYPEVLFSLYNTSRESKVYKTFFDPSLSVVKMLTMSGNLSTGRVNGTYDDKDDYRYRMWASTISNSKEVTYLNKYKDETEADSAYHYRYMIPLVRVSELYLIAAECETDVPTALEKYFNKLRFARNCVNQNASSVEELKGLIRSEYVREFIGEGQLFFYYKRNGLQTIPDGATTSGTMNMQLENYVFPLPDSETSQRAGSQDNVSQE